MSICTLSQYDTAFAGGLFHDTFARAKYEVIGVWCMPPKIIRGMSAPASEQEQLLDLQFYARAVLDVEAIDRGSPAPQGLTQYLQSFESAHQRIHLRWRKASSSFIPGGASGGGASSTKAPLPAETIVAETPETFQWSTSPEGVLRRLRESHLSARDLSQAVLFAEVTSFDHLQTEELLPLLFAFIKRHRFSSDEGILTAVGSAIRKFAMNAPQAEFERYADLLRPSRVETLPCEIELEFCKAILWRLTAEPPATPGMFPNLTARLTEIAEDYLSPRLILQKNYATIVLNSVLAVLVLAGERSAELVRLIGELDLQWFGELFDRRLGRLRSELLSQGSDAALRAAAHLEQFQPAQAGESGDTRGSDAGVAS